MPYPYIPTKQDIYMPRVEGWLNLVVTHLVAILGFIGGMILVGVLLTEFPHNPAFVGLFLMFYGLLMFGLAMFSDFDIYLAGNFRNRESLLSDCTFPNIITGSILLGDFIIVASLFMVQASLVQFGTIILASVLIFSSVWGAVYQSRRIWKLYGYPELQRRRRGKKSSIKTQDIKRMIASKDIEGLVSVLLNDSNFRIRERAVEGLGLLNDERSIDALLKALADIEVTVRIWAAASLVRMGDLSGMSILEAAFLSENPIQREWAAKASHGIDNSTILMYLRELEHDSIRSIRKAAKKSLGKL
jgi:hypothetical protein